MDEPVTLCLTPVDPDLCFHTEQDHIENEITGLKECQLCSCTEWMPVVE